MKTSSVAILMLGYTLALCFLGICVYALTLGYQNSPGWAGVGVIVSSLITIAFIAINES